MKELLKFITCGSVDDGKSTLIGHILYDAKLLFADQEKALILDSKVGSREGKIDYSLLLDGLMAEREQGITIDVAYRYFSTEKRSFIVADTPGHEQYTRNMAVGASFADLAVILVDASQGVLSQTRRHTRICDMMGIRHFVFAVNKMDLVSYDEKTFQKIEKEITELMNEFSYDTLQMIPLSATEGDNVTKRSENMKWYTGVVLLDYLEQIDITASEEQGAFILPVQRVCRPNHHFRGFQGQIASGTISTGDRIVVYPSKETSRVETIYQNDRQVESSSMGHAVTISLEDEIDISRGCVLAKDDQLIMNRMIEADILWMDEEELIPGKGYLLQIGTQKIPAVVTEIKHKIDIHTGETLKSARIQKNELATCMISADRDIVYDLFGRCKDMGTLILIDRVSHMTSACGVVKRTIRSNDNLFWQNMDITRELRENRLGQKAMTIWMTGLSGAGKSTIANALEKKLFVSGKTTMILDGDNVRIGLNKDLGFSKEDREENIRRVAEVAKLMNDAGIIVIVSFISPFREDRRNAKKIIGDAFREIYISTSVEECTRRDTKGLYKKALQGLIPNFTGVSSPYEAPRKADVVVDTEGKSVDICVNQIMEALEL